MELHMGQKVTGASCFCVAVRRPPRHRITRHGADNLSIITTRAVSDVVNAHANGHTLFTTWDVQKTICRLLSEILKGCLDRNQQHYY